MEWESFILSEVFDISSTNSGIDKNKIKNIDIGGYNPYITRTDKNNGIDDFIIDQDYALNEGNVITIGLDTQTVFYQPHSFYTGQNIQILSNKYLNKYVGLYFVNLLKILLEKFNWGGNGATLTRLKNSRILLPVNDVGVPDYDFMEDYMKTIEKEQINKYKKYIEKLETDIGGEVNRLDNVEWCGFYIKDLFEIYSGKRLTKANMQYGDIPFIGATSLNNGITDYVSNKNDSMDSNVLGVNYNGSVVENFYHPYKCLFSDDVKRFHLKHYSDNKYVLLFFKSIILKQKVKYMYGYKFNSERMNNQIILVPVDDSGEPDYVFMGKYMMSLEKKLLAKYLDFVGTFSVGIF